MSADRVVGASPRERPERPSASSVPSEQGAPPREEPQSAPHEGREAGAPEELSGAEARPGRGAGPETGRDAGPDRRPDAAPESAPEPARDAAPETGRHAAPAAEHDAREAKRPPQAEPAAAPEARAEASQGAEPEEHGEGPARDEAEEIERELAALSEKAAKADEYLELAQRTRADFENYRKRAAREAAAAQERGIAKLARELLVAIDNLDRALAAAEAHGDGDGAPSAEACMQLLSGIRLVHADVLAAFARVGIEPFSPVGERFDPQYHEAVAQQPREGAEPGTVIEVYQLGYKHRDEVLRPARVLVAA
jgi:molecular chaperone GrpE